MLILGWLLFAGDAQADYIPYYFTYENEQFVSVGFQRAWLKGGPARWGGTVAVLKSVGDGAIYIDGSTGTERDHLFWLGGSGTVWWGGGESLDTALAARGAYNGSSLSTQSVSDTSKTRFRAIGAESWIEFGGAWSDGIGAHAAAGAGLRTIGASRGGGTTIDEEAKLASGDYMDVQQVGGEGSMSFRWDGTGLYWRYSSVGVSLGFESGTYSFDPCFDIYGNLLESAQDYCLE